MQTGAGLDQHIRIEHVTAWLIRSATWRSSLLGGHRRHGVAQPDPLVERGERAEFHPPPQGGLADEPAGEGLRESRSELAAAAGNQKLERPPLGQHLQLPGEVLR
jgi:hypothetical protein